MNQDILAGKWKQIRGEVRKTWAKLTDDDIENIGGDYESLIGFIQERYGYTRQQASHEVERFLETVGQVAEKLHL